MYVTPRIYFNELEFPYCKSNCGCGFSELASKELAQNINLWGMVLNSNSCYISQPCQPPLLSIVEPISNYVSPT